MVRFFLVPFGFMVAAATSLLVAVTLGLEKITHAMHGEEGDLATLGAIFDLLEKSAVLLAGASLLPALGVIIIGEVARIRSWLYYMIGGGLALGCLPLLARVAAAQAAAVPPDPVWQVLATAGFAGGLAYWLIAGRGA
jgi:hypothetical protein